MLPDAHGVIKTENGAFVLFTLQGRTIWIERQGKQLLSAIFESGDEHYKWLNNTFCILEGVFDSNTFTRGARVYSCISDLI